MAKNFANRFTEISINLYNRKPFLFEMAKKISSGKAVFLKNKLTLIFFLIRMAKYVKDEDPDFLDLIHVSQHGSTSIPYFIPSFQYPDSPIYRDMNKMYAIQDGIRTLARKSLARKPLARKSLARKPLARKSLARKPIARKSLARNSLIPQKYPLVMSLYNAYLLFRASGIRASDFGLMGSGFWLSGL